MNFDNSPIDCAGGGYPAVGNGVKGQPLAPARTANTSTFTSSPQYGPDEDVMGNALLPSEKYRVASGPRNNNNLLPFTLLCSLFFLWAVANNFNDILLPQFQEAFTLNNFQAGLIQSSFYFGYFIIPIPAGILMKKLNYKSGMITGLMFYAAGAALFWPAAQTMNYSLFLAGLFIIAAGLGCLETAANPFVTVLGPEESGHFRINLAQTFNSFGAIIAVVFGQNFILSHVPHQPPTVLDSMTPEALACYRHSLVMAVQTPYMLVVAVVLTVALLILLTPFPPIHSESGDEKPGGFFHATRRLLGYRHWRWAVMAQFCYVGAQTACWSYLIRYGVEEVAQMTPDFAANYLTATMVCFFVGRFSGTWLIRRFAPQNVLAACALAAMLTCLIAAAGGQRGLMALTLCSLFMSIQYPTIFSLGIRKLGHDTKYGASIIVMTIVGGGIVTPVMGYVSDAAGAIAPAELIPALCFGVIFFFARFRCGVKPEAGVAAVSH